MGRISEEDIIRVREATDLVQLVSETTPLRQKGRLFWGLCPFHGEKTPSLKIDPSTQLWHCFGCSLGGGAFDWTMRTENLEFPDAVRRLADRARIEIVEDAAGGMPRGQRERLTAAHEAAAEYFHETLTTSKDAGAAVAREYLKGRDFGSEVAKRWKLGYATGGRSGLAAHLTKAGFGRDELIAANLALGDPGGALKDRFFGRVMFPIADVTGRFIAFGGRVIGDGQPKYLNSSDTPIFHKSANMYGIDRAKNAIVRTGTAVVVEGYTDVIALHEAGIDNAVATLGTALTAKHLKLLGRFAKRIVYLFDGDAAGLRAADRAAEFLDRSATPEAGSARMDLAVAIIPGGADPADIVATGGAEPMRELIAGAVPLLRFVIDRRLEAHDLSTPEGRAQALAAAARALAAVKGSILVEEYARYVADRLSAAGHGGAVSAEAVAKAVRLAQPETAGGPLRDEEPDAAESAAAAAAHGASAPKRRPALDAQSKAEDALLRSLVVAPELREEVRDLLSIEDALTDPVNARLAAAIVAAGDATGKGLYEAVARSEPELVEELTAWLVDAPSRESVLGTFAETVSRIKGFALRRQILRVQACMQGTDPVKDPQAYDDMFRQVASLQSQLETLRAGNQ
ncbi:MAG: DNA primase [Coriobacteriia bacterium]|nr:DNA primase [Coriobacteriia bacterium]